MKLHLVFAALLVSGCVTVDVGSSKSEPAKNVSYDDPQNPFEKSKTKTSDHLWLSHRTGNSISYLSDCGATQEPTLEQLESEALSSLSELKVLNTQKIQYNHREALKTMVEGRVDGVPVKMNLVTLKKNNCNYTLVYGAVSKNFETEISHFEKFVGSFKAP